MFVMTEGVDPKTSSIAIVVKCRRDACRGGEGNGVSLQTTTTASMMPSSCHHEVITSHISVTSGDETQASCSTCTSNTQHATIAIGGRGESLSHVNDDDHHRHHDHHHHRRQCS